MRAIEQLRRSNSIKELKSEYDLRARLRREMVGTLYPDILASQMKELDERYTELSRICEENKTYLLEKWKTS